MSTSEDSDVPEKPKRPKEVLDDNVSLVSVTTGCDQFRSISFRVFLAVIFLAVGVGAVVYSVYISEKNESSDDNNNNTETEYFNIRVNQMCDNGTFTLEKRLGTSENLIESVVVTIGTSWIQDNDRERLYHRVGLSPKDWEYTIFVHKTFLIYSTKQNCTKDYGMNYNKYLDSLGVSSLKKRNRTESVSINGVYYPAVIYDGEPPMGVTIHGQHPNLMFAYVNPVTGVTYGWEAFFTRTGNSSLYRSELWFPNMSNAPIDQSIFFDFPLNCAEINSTDSSNAVYL